MDNQRTCGQGLAANAELPAKLGLVAFALADVLETHLQALDIADPASRMEREAYMDLIRENREAALQLQAIATQMADYRDLPMGKHFEEAMAAAPVLESFQRFVKAEHELLSYLQQRIEEDHEMLSTIEAVG